MRKSKFGLKPFSPKELEIFFKNITDERFMMICLTGLFLGLRISEIANLKKVDVNFEAGVVYIQDGKNPNRTEQGYGKFREVPINIVPGFSELLEKWCSVVQGDYVFPNRRGKEKLTKQTIDDLFRKHLEQTELLKIKGKDKIGRKLWSLSFHSLRKTLGSFLRDTNVPFRDISDVLGHNDTATTMIYTDSAYSIGKRVQNKVFSVKASDKYFTKIEQISESPMTILKKRLALGEINVDEYRKLTAMMMVDLIT